MSIRELQIDQQPPDLQKIIARFKDLEASLLEKRPALAEAIIDIHKGLQQNEELVHLLDDDDISLLHKSFESYKQFKLVQKEVKEVKKAGKKKLTNSDLDNL